MADEQERLPEQKIIDAEALLEDDNEDLFKSAVNVMILFILLVHKSVNSEVSVRFDAFTPLENSP